MMGVAANLNYLKNVYRHPCATPDIVILVETALPAAALSLFEVVGIGCNDIVKMKIGKSPWHTRKWNAFFKQQFVPEKISKNIFRFSTPYDTIEAGLWYWMVTDAASAFTPNWMSLIYQEQKCDLPRSGYIETGLNAAFNGGGPPVNIPPGGLESKSCCRFDGDGVTVPQGCYASISYEVNMCAFRPDLFGPGSCRVWLEDDEGNKSGVSNPDTNPDTGIMRAAGGVNRTKPTTFGQVRYQVKFQVFSGVVGCCSGTIRVSAYGKRMDIIGAGCTPKDVEYPWATKLPPYKPPPPPAPDPSKYPPGVPTPLGRNMRRDNRGYSTPNVKPIKFRQIKPARRPRKKRSIIITG